ncbi:tyrosine-protein kinase BAZ1B isoform X2 [Cherax quadricarinatus]|uniref:tyrosine-protein kinase BAZ1B isoform X2 n=1 Tax=Cherax quadricarinatus TaxID=27406 RepID=UPI0023791431|nr:tyrosine-protein kinase BAZ1B-like isoform X2 [Cherax quadricarinatus]
MPLLQGQQFRLIKPPGSIEPGTQLFTIQHTGEKFLSKSDYEDRLALYSQSIWTCQCTGKSGLTHQEAWTSEAKVRVLLSSSFPTPLLPPILRTLHHSTLPLDQLVEAASTLCYTRFHHGEELTLLGPQPIQVRVISSKENNCITKKENITNGKKTSPLSKDSATPLTNGCSPHACESPVVNGTHNGTTDTEESSPKSEGKGKEDSPGKKKNMLLPLLYDVSVIGEDRIMTDVPAKYLQRTYKVPPKEHFRLFVRANAIRQRSSAYTPWLVSEELVKQFNIPSKLASIFTHPRTHALGRKRKAEGLIEEKHKKAKGEKVLETVKKSKDGLSSRSPKVRKRREKRDPNAPRRKPGPKPGFKRTPKPVPKLEPPKPSSKIPKVVKIESSDSEEDVCLAVLANRSPKVENGTPEKTKMVTPPSIVPLLQPRKKEIIKDGKDQAKGVRKMKQATLFDLKTSTKKNADGTPKAKFSPRKSPQKKFPTPEAVMRIPIMKKMVNQYSTLKGLKGTGRKLVHTMDQVLKKLSLQQIEVIPNVNLREDILKRNERMVEKNILAKMTPEEKEEYLKQKAKEEAKKRLQSKREQNRKMEDKILSNLKPLPQPQLVPTPEEIPNSLFGDVAMVVEFIECYHGIVHTDKKKSISCSQLMQALAAGPIGLKYVAEVMCLILHLIIDDVRLGGMKELGVKISDLPVHYQTALELARLCLSKRDFSESASLHSDDNVEEGEEQNELSDGLIHKLESSELYELQPSEVIAVLKALCHQAIASDTVLEHVEEIEEKVYTLYKERAQIKKISLKEEMEKKKQRKQERLQKKINKTKTPKKSPGRPRGYSPKKKAHTIDKYCSKKEEDQDLDLASRVKRRRLTNEEKEKNKILLNEQRMEEEEKQRRLFVVQEYERVLMQKEMLIRLQPLGLDRNHDRYWLFNNTTPGLYVEKGWVDPNTTYRIKAESPRKQQGGLILNGNEDSGSDSDDKPLATIKEELSTGSPRKETLLSRPKPLTQDEEIQTFPPVGQNMWFYYNSIKSVDELLQSLAEKGIRESRLKANIIQVKKQLENNLTKEWNALEDLQDGALQLVESLREDIIQIEHELTEGWLGAVPNKEEWEKKAQQATSLQELGECLMEAQKSIHFKYLKGMMQPSKKLIPSDNTDAAPEYEELESPAVLKWRDAVLTCQTFSRMHMLVGMFDSCIKWEKSIATKKCKVCRHQNSTIPLTICDKCESSYHWSCLRPQLREEPPEPWLCPGCHPVRSSRLERHKRNSVEDPSEKEKVCRVCERGLGLIFCCLCPAAYHSECHDPPLQTRARKDWACVDCNARKRRGYKNIRTTRTRYQSNSEEELVSERKSTFKGSSKKKNAQKHVRNRSKSHGRTLRGTSRRKYMETDDDNEEEEDDDDDDDNEDDCDYMAPPRLRHSTRRVTNKRKNYKISSEDEEEENITEQEEEMEEDNIEQDEEEDGDIGEQEEEEDNGEQDDEDEENRDQDEEDEENGEQDEEDEEYMAQDSCTYCGLGLDKNGTRARLLPCITCDTCFHPECACEAVNSKTVNTYQCSKCLRASRSPSRSPVKTAKSNDDEKAEDGPDAIEEEEEEENGDGEDDEGDDEQDEEEDEDGDDEQDEEGDDEQDEEGDDEQEEDDEKGGGARRI